MVFRAVTYRQIRKGYLKKDTEGLIFAAQEQALRMNWTRKNIDGQKVSRKRRMCGERDESITHLIAECKKLAQKEYKQRHDNIPSFGNYETMEHLETMPEVQLSWQGQMV